jgi:hypothetical protein
MNFRSSALSLTLLSLCAPIGSIAAEDTAAPAAAPAATPAPAPAPAPAAPAAPDNGPTFTGFVDTTYNYNFNDPNNQVNTYHTNDAKANSFALNHAQLQVAGSPKGDSAINYVAKLDFGTDIAGFSGDQSGGGSGAYVTMEEAYGTYTHDVWSVKVGKFDTYEGIEVIDNLNNVEITRGLLYWLIEPGTHTGVVGIYTPNTTWDFEVGVVNGWDLISDNNQGKTLIFKGSYSKGDPLLLVVDGTYGNEVASPSMGGPPISGNRLSLDAVATTKIVKNTVINVQLDYGSEKDASVVTPGANAHWFGAGIQPIYTINDKWSLGGRLEYLSDPDGARTGATSSQHLFTISVCPAYQVTPHFLSRVEARYDVSNLDVYYSKDDSTTGAGTPSKKNQGEIAAESIFSF